MNSNADPMKVLVLPSVKDSEICYRRLFKAAQDGGFSKSKWHQVLMPTIANSLTSPPDLDLFMEESS